MALSARNESLTWQELIFLHTNKIGLVSVANARRAGFEFLNGGCNDAISLAAFAYPFAHCSQIEKKLAALRKNGSALVKVKYLYENVFPDETTVDEFCPDDKTKLIERMMTGIQQQLKRDFKQHPEPAFLLVYRGMDAIMPMHSNTNPLGICGRSTFQKPDVKKIICRSEDDWNEATAFNTIIKTIKKAFLENKVSDEKRMIAESVNQQYLQGLKKRLLAPDKSRNVMLAHLGNAIEKAETEDQIKSALINMVRELRTANVDGTKKYGFSLLGLRHFGDYRKSRVYLFVKDALSKIDPEIDLEYASQPEEPKKRKRSFI